MIDEPASGTMVEIQNDKKNIWDPVVRSTTTNFLKNAVSADNHVGFQNSATSILSQGIDPGGARASSKTGLVVGHVQSGKTLSFETVIALARDNGFSLCILIAGTKTNLLKQSHDRLAHDFGINNPSKNGRVWRFFQNLDNREADNIRAIRQILEEWRDEDYKVEKKRTIVITVLKQVDRIRQLAQVMASIRLDGLATLIVDDEADNASLNTRASRQDGDESGTYREIMNLREQIPLHTFLQYTATPQANLLININDTLSPSFVHVLTPGEKYCGGITFFTDNPNLIRNIPAEDIPQRGDHFDSPPESLIAAMRVFVVGVAISEYLELPGENRSMIVHPSMARADHDTYHYWVNSVMDEWIKCIMENDRHQDKIDLLKDFRIAYDDLSETVTDTLPDFEKICSDLKYILGKIQIFKVNAERGSTPEVNWADEYAWILVGGAALDRGFTVEGLTVTYLSRNLGGGQADSLQQRARFFGYKKDYLGFCRIYLSHEVENAFRQYIQHEENIREQLRDISKKGLSLKDWKRAFLLDRRLAPCRRNVLDLESIRGGGRADWFVSRNLQSERTLDEKRKENKACVYSFLSELSLIEDEGHPDRTETQVHEVARDISLRNATEKLLLNYKILDSEHSNKFYGVLVQIAAALDINPDEVCDIYTMSKLKPRQRSIPSNLFQGSNNDIYPGDRRICSDDRFTIQIHNLEITDGNHTIAYDEMVLAIRVPDRLASGWFVQNKAD